MEEKHTCELNHDEYELLCFYRELSEERKEKFLIWCRPWKRC